jgi:hypothetical protein
MIATRKSYSSSGSKEVVTNENPTSVFAVNPSLSVMEYRMRELA